MTGRMGMDPNRLLETRSGRGSPDACTPFVRQFPPSRCAIVTPEPTTIGATLQALDRAISESPPEQLPLLSCALAAQLAAIASRQLEAAALERSVKAVPDETLDITEAARRIGMSESWLYKAKVPFRIKVGSRVRYSARGIERYLRARQGTA